MKVEKMFLNLVMFFTKKSEFNVDFQKVPYVLIFVEITFYCEFVGSVTGEHLIFKNRLNYDERFSVE
jgi:hypothetical protein